MNASIVKKQLLLACSLMFSILFHQNGYSQIIQPGCQYWGACMHLDRSGAYWNIPLSQQIADLKYIFGNTPNTIIYRGEMGTSNNFTANTNQLQSAGIIPMALVIGYPNWNNWHTNGTSSASQEAAAYTWAYNTVANIVKANPNQLIWEVGNEWDLQGPIFDQLQNIGDNAQNWQNVVNLPAFPMYRGAHAGATAAIRDNNPKAQVVGGASAGWNKAGFVSAIGQGTIKYAPQGGRNLCFDFSCIHFYVDGRPSPSNNHGMPHDLNYIHGNQYTNLNPSLRPWYCTEFGSSDDYQTAHSNQCATNMTNLLNNFEAHEFANANEQGMTGGTVYELYTWGNVSSERAYRLYDYNSGSSHSGITTVGTAVKNWIANNPCTLPSPKVACAASQAPVIDGVMESFWTSIPDNTISKTIIGTAPSASDLSATYKLAWDNSNLYLLVRVKDNALMHNAPNAPWDGDAIEVFVDGGNEKVAYYGANDHQYIFRLNDNTVFRYKEAVAQATNPAGVVFKQGSYAGGYLMEIKIAWSAIGTTASNGKLVGLEIQIDDADASTRETAMSSFTTSLQASNNPWLFGTIKLDATQCSISTGINSNEIFSEIKIYPNPSNGNFYVNIPTEIVLQDASIRLYDVLGKEVKNISINNTETVVEREGLQAGIYFYSIINNNKTIGKGKLITQ